MRPQIITTNLTGVVQKKEFHFTTQIKNTLLFYEKKKPRSDIKNLEKETQLNLTDGNENWAGIPGSQVCHLKLLFSSKSHCFNELSTT